MRGSAAATETGPAVVARFDSGRLCAQRRSLVPPVKTRDFGMTPEGWNGRRFQTEPPRASAVLVHGPLRIFLGLHDMAVAHVDDAVAVLGGFRIMRDHQYRLS